MRWNVASLVLLLAGCSNTVDPDCSGPAHWPAMATFARLKNQGILTNDQVDFTRTESVQLSSEQIGRDRYRQRFRIRYALKDGTSVEAFVQSDASDDECSMSPVIIERVDTLAPNRTFREWVDSII